MKGKYVKIDKKAAIVEYAQKLNYMSSYPGMVIQNHIETKKEMSKIYGTEEEEWKLLESGEFNTWYRFLSSDLVAVHFKLDGVYLQEYPTETGECEIKLEKKSGWYDLIVLPKDSYKLPNNYYIGSNKKILRNGQVSFKIDDVKSGEVIKIIGLGSIKPTIEITNPTYGPDYESGTPTFSITVGSESGLPESGFLSDYPTYTADTVNESDYYNYSPTTSYKLYLNEFESGYTYINHNKAFKTEFNLKEQIIESGYYNALCNKVVYQLTDPDIESGKILKERYNYESGFSSTFTVHQSTTESGTEKKIELRDYPFTFQVRDRHYAINATPVKWKSTIDYKGSYYTLDTSVESEGKETAVYWLKEEQ